MTKKLYDQDSHLAAFLAKVVACTPAEEGKWHVILDQTAFFPEGGGQPADAGTIDAVSVLDVQEAEDAIIHVTGAPLEVGKYVAGVIDWSLRFQRMQFHSGEHVISGLAHRLFGCNNVGFHMEQTEVVLDFDKELTPEEIALLETRANEAICQNIAVTAEYPDPAVLAELDYRSKLDLTENVRIVTIPTVDICACCAPHVKQTGEIGLVKILESMRHRGGIRLWMTAGGAAIADYISKHESVTAISGALSVKRNEVVQGVERMKQELQDTKQALTAARHALVEEKCKNLPETQGNLCLFEEGLEVQSLRALANAGMERCGGICAVFTGSDSEGYRYVMGSRTVDLRERAKEIGQALGGKGGGQPTMIQGSLSASRKEIEDYFA